MDLKPRLLEITKGDESAAHFLVMLSAIYRVWDNLIDKDKPVTDADIHSAMWIALIELPRNEFYIKHFSELNPIMSLGIQNWLGSNSLAASEIDSDKYISFITRGAEADLCVMVALICGGYEWAQEVGPKIRREWHKQSFADYLKDLPRKSHELGFRTVAPARA